MCVKHSVKLHATFNKIDTFFISIPLNSNHLAKQQKACILAPALKTYVRTCLFGPLGTNRAIYACELVLVLYMARFVVWVLEGILKFTSSRRPKLGIKIAKISHHTSVWLEI